MENQQESMSESARGIADRLRSDGRQTIESRKRSAADQIEEVAQALGRAGEQLDQNQPTLAAYATQISTSVGNLATRLRDGSIEQLLDDTRQIARRNPGLFILGGFAVGVALSRFLKASEQSMQSDQQQDFSSNFADATTTQEDYPSRAYSPSMSSDDQTYTPGSGG
jgi:hypothetical protein